MSLVASSARGLPSTSFAMTKVPCDVLADLGAVAHAQQLPGHGKQEVDNDTSDGQMTSRGPNSDLTVV